MNRELDAKVAEVIGDNPDKCAYCGFPRRLHDGPNTCTDFRFRPYSGNPEACEMVKEEMRRKGWGFEIKFFVLTDRFQCSIFDGQGHSFTANSKKEHEAVCLAFLAAVESEQAHASAK